VIQLAQGLNMTRDGGNGVIVLSKVTYVDATDCASASVASSDCANKDNAVVIQRIYIGRKGLHDSAFGTPSDTIIDGAGKIAPVDYLENTSAKALGFKESVLTGLSVGEFAYMAEMFTISPDYNLWSSFNSVSVNARSIF